MIDVGIPSGRHVRQIALRTGQAIDSPWMRVHGTALEQQEMARPDAVMVSVRWGTRSRGLGTDGWMGRYEVRAEVRAEQQRFSETTQQARLDERYL